MSTGGWIILAVVIIIAVASVVTAIRIRRSTRIPKIRHINPVPDRPKTNENPILREVSTRPRYEQRLDEQLTAKRVPLPRSDTSEKKFQDKRNTALRRDDSIDMGGLSTSPMTPGHPLFSLYVGGGLGADSERSNFPNDRGGDSNDSSSPSGGYEATPTPTTSSWSSSSGDGWGGHSSSHSSDHSGGYSGGSDSGGSFGGDSSGGGDGGGGGE